MPSPRGFVAPPVVLLAALLLARSGSALAQQCTTPRAGRIAVIVAGYAVGETAAILVRHDDWWTSPRAAFHVNWAPSPSRQQDRLLHAELSYQAAQLGALAFDWACVDRTTAGWLGAALGVAIALPKEVGDGLHQNKGFSAPDMLWTAGGAMLPALHRAWTPARAVTLEANYWPSVEYRTTTGDQPQLESDYAGQRYFVTINPARLPGGAGGWPDWLGVAVGHGVPHWVSSPPVDVWYVTLDFDWRGLPLRAQWWRAVAGVLDQVHLPAPGVKIESSRLTVGLF